MKLVSKTKFFIGLFVLAFMLFSYFIKFVSESGPNYIVEDRLLGVIIFHSAFVFVLYIILACFLIFTGVKRIRII